MEQHTLKNYSLITREGYKGWVEKIFEEMADVISYGLSWKDGNQIILEQIEFYDSSDDRNFFIKLAPLLIDDSYLSFVDDAYALKMWIFENGSLHEVEGMIVFKE